MTPIELRDLDGKFCSIILRDKNGIDYEALTKDFLERCMSNGLLPSDVTLDGTSILHFRNKYYARCAYSLWTYLVGRSKYQKVS